MYHHAHLTALTAERTDRYRALAERHRLAKTLRRRRRDTPGSDTTRRPCLWLTCCTRERRWSIT
jgi:hypothetical protein